TDLVQLSRQVLLELGSDYVQLNVLIGGVIFEHDVPIDFSGALPGLGLDIKSDIKFKMDYKFGLGIGFSIYDGIYIDTTSSEEFALELSASLEGANGAPAKVDASLGFLNLKLEDVQLGRDQIPGTQDDRNSGLYGNLGIDLQDKHGTGRLKLTELGSLDFEIRMTAGAELAFDANVDIGSGASFPSVSTRILYDQTFAEATLSKSQGASASFGGRPRLVLENVTLDLGEFISNFMGPILENIQLVTKPIEPLVEILTTPIPVISDLGGPVTLLDLAEQYGGKKFNRKYVDAVVAVVNVINSVPTDGSTVMISFGDFVIMDGTDKTDLRNPSKTLKNSANTTQNDQSYRDKGGLDGQMDNPEGRSKKGKPTAKKASSKTKGFMSKLRNLDGLSIPLLSSPSTIFGLISGKDVVLFEYDMPKLVASFEYVKTFPTPLPGLNARLGGTASFTVDLGFGFDTSGINKFQTSNNAADIFTGFYLMDRNLAGVDRDEFVGRLEITAGASLGIGGIIEAGVEGGLFAQIGFNLHDTPTVENPQGDGKIRFDEISERIPMGPICLFDTSGELGVFLRAFLQIKIPLGFTDVVIFDEDFELFRATLASFNHKCIPGPPPTFATLNEDTKVLTLNMGPTRFARRDNWKGETPAIDESVQIRRITLTEQIANNAPGDYYHISLNNLPDREKHPVNGEIRIDRLYAVDKVTQIEANMGEGDDIIKIHDDIDADLILRGGPGNDTIVVGKQKPEFSATLYGDEGNDQLRGNSNPDTIYGGPDADVIQGLGGNDILYGEGGDDRMLGGEGDDLLYGGDETGEKSGDRMQGGTGNDLMFGGSGHDHITGDEGNDWISGEDGNDTLVGDGIIDDTDGFTFSDVLLGGPGDDDLTGNIGRDYVLGDAGDDSINWKMAGAQTGAGSTDEDAVAPGDEVDFLIDGGDGSDTFFVTSSKSAEGDTIVLARENLSTSSSSVSLPGDYVTTAKNNGHTPSLRASRNRGQRAVRISVSNNSITEPLDSTTTENLVINAGRGEDTITLNDLNGSDVKHIEFDLGSGGGWTTKQEDALDSYSTGTVTVENATDGSIVTLNGGASGTFKLQLGGQTTGQIEYGNTKVETASNIQAALTGLGIEASVESISNTDSYKIDFRSSTTDSVTPLQFVETNLTALKPSIGVSQNSIQRLALERGTGGTFKLQFGNDPSNQTAPIRYSANPSEMATNISNALQS
ncbi:MAG: hypothetical protein MK179_21210, partial [Pirellulaceae bacterium]|nr:hypothetical protein [Pirellulaceae bacterium]